MHFEKPTGRGIDVPLESVALARLVDEVRNGECRTASSYNRTYNRHNR